MRAMRTVRDPRGHSWTVRERWLHPIGGLPPNDLADSFELGNPLFAVFALGAALLGLVASLAAWLLRFPLAAFKLGFGAPLIEAERAGEPHVKLTWRARDRQVGPEVVDRVAAAIQRGEIRPEVEGASFLRFD
jgi:hypothetical protein